MWALVTPIIFQSLGVSNPEQVDLLLKTFYTGRREKLTEEEKQTMADIALRSESTYSL
jgi:hypothetical protein